MLGWRLPPTYPTLGKGWALTLFLCQRLDARGLGGQKPPDWEPHLLLKSSPSLEALIRPSGAATPARALPSAPHPCRHRRIWLLLHRISQVITQADSLSSHTLTHTHTHTHTHTRTPLPYPHTLLGYHSLRGPFRPWCNSTPHTPAATACARTCAHPHTSPLSCCCDTRRSHTLFRLPRDPSPFWRSPGLMCAHHTLHSHTAFRVVSTCYVPGSGLETGTIWCLKGFVCLAKGD